MIKQRRNKISNGWKPPLFRRGLWLRSKYALPQYKAKIVSQNWHLPKHHRCPAERRGAPVVLYSAVPQVGTYISTNTFNALAFLKQTHGANKYNIYISASLYTYNCFIYIWKFVFDLLVLSTEYCVMDLGLSGCWGFTSWQHLPSYQNGYRLVPVCTHGDFTVLCCPTGRPGVRSGYVSEMSRRNVGRLPTLNP